MKKYNFPKQAMKSELVLHLLKAHSGSLNQIFDLFICSNSYNEYMNKIHNGIDKPCSKLFIVHDVNNVRSLLGAPIFTDHNQFIISFTMDETHEEINEE